MFVYFLFGFVHRLALVVFFTVVCCWYSEENNSHIKKCQTTTTAIKHRVWVWMWNMVLIFISMVVVVVPLLHHDQCTLFSCILPIWQQNVQYAKFVIFIMILIFSYLVIFLILFQICTKKWAMQQHQHHRIPINSIINAQQWAKYTRTHLSYYSFVLFIYSV